MRANVIRLSSVTLLVAVCFTTSRAEEKPKLSKDLERILKETNAERAKEKLPALKLNALLNKAAQKHSENMARQKKMDHELDDKSPADRIRKVGYAFSWMGENIAMGMTPAEVVGVWMKSKGHRANILGKNYSEIGIGLARDEDGLPYYTQVFGTPLNTAGE